MLDFGLWLSFLGGALLGAVLLRQQFPGVLLAVGFRVKLAGWVRGLM